MPDTIRIGDLTALRARPRTATRPPVLFVHGIFADAREWTDWLPFFAARGFPAKLRVWLGPPAATYAADVASRAPAAPARVPSGAAGFAVAFALIIVATVAFMYLAPSLPALPRAGGAIALMVWLVAGAAALERRRRTA